jgi:cytochrome c oxidase subunit 4
MSGAGSHPNYVAVFLWLAALTGVELGIAFLPWSKLVLILILLGLAVWKALLVGLYFMHMRWEGKRLRIVVLAPLPLTVIVVIATLTEYVW